MYKTQWGTKTGDSVFTHLIDLSTHFIQMTQPCPSARSCGRGDAWVAWALPSVGGR